MDRHDVQTWLEEHPEAREGDPAALVEKCERAVRRHAIEDAWLAAKAFATERAREWEKDWSPPASEDFVAREICHQLAWELRRHEPEVGAADADHLAGGPVMEALAPAGQRVVAAWVRDLATLEEHLAWEEIVRFTDHHGPTLIRENGMTRELGWDEGHRYSVIAAHVLDLLAREYSVRAHPR